jgi:hypothetical protein
MMLRGFIPLHIWGGAVIRKTETYYGVPVKIILALCIFLVSNRFITQINTKEIPL